MTKKWSEYQREFDKLMNLDDIFYFLQDLVDELKICENATCVIFPNLYKLDKARLDYEYKTIAEAKESIKNTIELQKFTEFFMKYLLDAKQVIAEIYALKVSVDTKRANQENKDAKFRDYLQICAKYGLTPEMDIQKGIQGIANAYAGGSLPLDQIQLDDKKILDAHVKKIREEEKKKKKGKEKEKEKETEDDE